PGTDVPAQYVRRAFLLKLQRTNRGADRRRLKTEGNKIIGERGTGIFRGTRGHLVVASRCRWQRYLTLFNNFNRHILEVRTCLLRDTRRGQQQQKSSCQYSGFCYHKLYHPLIWSEVNRSPGCPMASFSPAPARRDRSLRV